MEPFDLADAGVVIGLVGVSIGVYCLYLKYRINQLDRIIAEKEAAMNGGQPPSPSAR